MEVVIEQTTTTPLLRFDQGKLEVTGKAIPTIQNSFCSAFYEMVKDYVKKPQSFTQINLDLSHINGYSVKCLVRVLQLIDDLRERGFSAVVNWYYENNDDDMLELGLIFYSMFNLHFNFIRK